MTLTAKRMSPFPETRMSTVRPSLEMVHSLPQVCMGWLRVEGNNTVRDWKENIYIRPLHYGGPSLLYGHSCYRGQVCTSFSEIKEQFKKAISYFPKHQQPCYFCLQTCCKVHRGRHTSGPLGLVPTCSANPLPCGRPLSVVIPT